MYRKLLISAVLAVIFSATGCGNKMWEDTKDTAGGSFNYVFDTAPTARSYHDEESIPIIKINYNAADILAGHITDNELFNDSHIYFNLFVNAQNPKDDSIFGLVVTQQVADRLVQRNVQLTKGDPKPTDYFPPPGVDMEKYDSPLEYTKGSLPPRSALLDGHYVIGDHYVYVTAKIMRLDDNVIVSGHNWTIPLTDNVRHLLNQPRPDGGMKPSVKTQFKDQ